MRWRVDYTDNRPLEGALRYRIKFAFRTVRTTAVSGTVSWPEEMIWLEKVVEVQKYIRTYSYGKSGPWYHDRWYPLNDFTMSLCVHNNQ